MRREGARTVFIVALLVVTFLLTAFMAFRAQMAATYHRTAAVRVIGDWTRVAADEFARRADAQAGFYGTYPLLQAMLAGDEVNSPLVRCTFRFESSTCPPDVVAWLRPQLASLAAHPPPASERVPLHFGKRAFVYAISRDGKSVVAFEVDRSQLGPSFENVMKARPLLPRSLAEGRITNEAIRIRVLSDGGVVWASGPPLGGGVRVPGEGLLRNFTIEASIDPDVAPLLVFGGIPQPLRIYMITLALTGLLLFVALLQLRRERALARLRSDFVAGVSHELRTPLTQIRMFAETLLLGRVRSDEEHRRALTVIDQESRRLGQLVENVLQFSRGERGILRLSRAPVDVANVVRETIETFKPIAAARHVTIIPALTSATINADADAISQIALNLLDNAVKYGPANGEVRITVEHAGSAVRLIVQDQGAGVPPRDRKRIWRRYERLETNRATGGAGIGLAVVNELVALHGGKAWVEDGARFIVELPS